MHGRLLKAYGPQHWWPAESPFEVVLGAYLTQNTSWKAAELALHNLRKAGALNIEGIRNLSVDKLRELIRPSGFHTRKAPAIKAFMAMLDAEFEGSIAQLAAAPTSTLRSRLLELPAVGPETADAILLYALNHAVPVADEYLRRIATRHGLINPVPKKNRKGYESLVELTRRAFAPDSRSNLEPLFNEFHALTVAVGKRHCGKVPNCDHCPLANDLQHIRGNGPVDLT
jgi:endonuclease-3 related protein